MEGGPKVEYGTWDDSRRSAKPQLRELAARDDMVRILDVGGGANPALKPEFIERHGIDYTVLDISRSELDKAPKSYRKICADIADPGLDVAGGNYDLVYSNMLLEHVPDCRVAHRNVHELLRQGGLAFHVFPTLYHPAFVINRLAPEQLSHRLLSVLEPGRDLRGKHGKFPAYYRWCRGPVDRQIDRFESLGYTVDEYRGYYGTPYFERIPGLKQLSRRIALAFVSHPVPQLTSYAQVLLRKSSRRPTP